MGTGPTLSEKPISRKVSRKNFEKISIPMKMRRAQA